MSDSLTPNQPDLAALLASRICHDLISPIGAIGNGLELLMMEPATQGPEMALIAESVGHANARIRFFRVAFGAALPQQRLSAAEVVEILSDLTQGGRLSIAWQTRSDLPRVEVKIAFLLLLCLESALAYGGKISVQVDGGRWAIHAQAVTLRLDPALWAVLTQPGAAPEISPATVHFPLAAQEIARHQFRPMAEFGEDWIKLSF